MSGPLLQITDLRKEFAIPAARGGQAETLRAVDGVSLDVDRAETLGLVGESGCGKSTLGRCAVRLAKPTAGSVVFDGQDITARSLRSLRPLRTQLQIVFQDPLASLNPRRRIGQILTDCLQIHRVRGDHTAAVADTLDRVGLSPDLVNRFPHEFSGGQRQRVGIARALIHRPKLIVADEPVSALDVSIQGQIINLLQDLQDDLGIAYLFVAHDLGVIRQVSARVAVMYLGQVVELAPAEELYRAPAHPYTEALLSAVPVPDPDGAARRDRIVLKGDVPNPAHPPSGCRFHTRCRYATDICAAVVPELAQRAPGHTAACHHPLSPVEPAGRRAGRSQ